MNSCEIRFRCAKNLLLQKYPHKNITRIFDVAGGLDTSRLLWEAFGCDITENYLAHDASHAAKTGIIRQISPQIKFELGECIAVMGALAPNSYDLLYCGEIIEHIYDIRGFAEKCLRVLRPGGILLGTTPNLVSWQNRLRFLFGLNPSGYDPFPVRKRTLFSFEATHSDFALYEYHIRLSNPSMLMLFLNHMGFENPDYCTTDEYGAERSLHRLRYILNFILPKNWRENIIFIADKPL